MARAAVLSAKLVASNLAAGDTVLLTRLLGLLAGALTPSSPPSQVS